MSLFYDVGNGQALPSEEEESEQQQEGVEGEGSREQDDVDDDDDNDPISSIMESVKQQAPPSNGFSSIANASFTGRGFALNSSNDDHSSGAKTTSGDVDTDHQDGAYEIIRVKVIFYKDGFTAQEIEQQQQQDSYKNNNNEARRRRRRRGIHTFSSSTAASKQSQGDEPMLPPRRDYETNKKFIQNIQNSQVPIEFRRFLDNKTKGRRRPYIPVTILLDDRRPRLYPMKQYQQQQQQLREKQTLSQPFHGTGQTLGGSRTSAGRDGSRWKNSSNTSTTSQQEQRGRNRYQASNIISWIIDLLMSLFRLLVDTSMSLLGQHAPAPLEKHIVDSTKPTTTISLRFPQTPTTKQQQHQRRQKVIFNTNHTVNDLYTYCTIELQEQLQQQAKRQSSSSATAGITTTPEFELLSGFPPRRIPTSTNSSKVQEGSRDDDGDVDDATAGLMITSLSSTTLKEANLCNASVKVRIIPKLEDKRQN